MGLFKDRGYSPIQRKKLYLICILIRSIATICFMYNYGSVVNTLVATIASLSILLNMVAVYRGKVDWWSREFHILAAFAILYTNYNDYQRMLGIVLFIDILAGIYASPHFAT